MRVMRQIKAIMKNEAIKQVGLAKKTGISPVTINRWMTGAKKPSIESVEKLVNAMGYKILVYKDAKPDKYWGDLEGEE